MMSEKEKQFETIASELRRQVEDLQKKYHETRAEIDVYQQRYVCQLGKGKGKAYLYSAFRETSTQGAQVWITQGCPCKLHHTCVYLANVRQMAPPERQTSYSARYSFIDSGRMRG